MTNDTFFGAKLKSKGRKTPRGLVQKLKKTEEKKRETRIMSMTKMTATETQKTLRMMLVSMHTKPMITGIEKKL